MTGHHLCASVSSSCISVSCRINKLFLKSLQPGRKRGKSGKDVKFKKEEFSLTYFGVNFEEGELSPIFPFFDLAKV